MISYAQRELFSPRAVVTFQIARDLVSRVSAHLDQSALEIRCHELARAVAQLLVARDVEIRVVDGSLWSIEHTWILLPGQQGPMILDVYAPGRLPQVQLLAAHHAVSRGYAEGAPRMDVRVAVVEKLAREMGVVK